jgi:hypothetical protein
VIETFTSSLEPALLAGRMVLSDKSNLVKTEAPSKGKEENLLFYIILI